MTEKNVQPELPVRSSAGDTQWFTQARFGMMIHWGLYSLAARHEWVQHNEEIPKEKYQCYFDHFNPDLYNPEFWAQLAADAGMKYLVVTTKHHEGFCLWDSKLTDYKSTRTPCGKDLLRPMVNAFRRHDLRIGFYYSLIDWHHPQFVLDPHCGPYRSSPNRVEMNQDRSQAVYAEYLHGQVRELLSEFGKIDVMWFDYSYPRPDGSGKGKNEWQSEKLHSLVRQLQPHIILNDRLDLPDHWDVRTPEQFQPQEWVRVNGQRVVWETCQTFSGSWGYNRDEHTWKSVEQLIQLLVDSVSRGGNLLLNIGPNARGEIDPRATCLLRSMGEWMRLHSRSIYGCTEAPADLRPPAKCAYTYHPEARRLYLHLYAWPFVHIHLENLAGRVAYAQLLNDASEIKMTTGFKGMHAALTETTPESTLTLELPVRKPDVAVPVVELFLR